MSARPAPPPIKTRDHQAVPGPPVISAEAAAKTLCDYFLGNAERGDHAANDHFVAELVDRIRARQQPPDDGLGWPSLGYPCWTPPPVEDDGRG